MPAPTTPKLPIPTCLGWLLLESLIGGSLPEKLAQIAAANPALGEDAAKRQETWSKSLRLSAKGRRPRRGPWQAFMASLSEAVRHSLRKNVPGGPDAGEAIFRRLDAAVGPFAALAAVYVPPSGNAAHHQLLQFSNNLDQLGALFAEAAEKGDLEHAKDMLLGANWLDAAYWSFPEAGLEDPRLSREALRAVRNWEELTRAAAPLVLNTALCWLSWLDLALLAPVTNDTACSPMFTALATRFTPRAITALREGRPLLARKWSESVELPIPNLIKMLKNVAAHTNRMQRRAKRPNPRSATKGDREQLSAALKEFRRHRVLSIEQFNRLLMVLEPDSAPHSDEKCASNIRALHLATSLFSLLTPSYRKRSENENENRRRRPDTIFICEDLPRVYERWWQRNLTEVVARRGLVY